MSDLPEGFRPGDSTAHDRARTELHRATFTIKEGPQGQPKIMIEWLDEPLKILEAGDSFLMLQARENASFDAVRTLARDMHRLLDGVSHTVFIT